MKKAKRYILPGLLILFSVVFLVSAGFIIDYALDSNTQKSQYKELASLVDQVQQQQQQQQQQQPVPDPNIPGATLPPEPPVSPFVEVIHPETGETITMLREYAQVFLRNTHMVGWIKIPGTNVNYPVMQTPDSPNFYLDKDFYKKSSRHGTLYVNELASLTNPSDNVTIYGHKMADGTMFSDLLNYKDKQYFIDHPTIQFDTLTEHHTYQIMAIFATTTVPGEGFVYHTFVEGNVITFPEFVANCKALSLYDTGVDATYGDKLITLSTCDIPIGTKRFVIVAKRIS